MIGCSYVLPLAAKIFVQVASTSPATKSTNLAGSSGGAFSQLRLRRFRCLRQGAGAGIDAEAAPASGKAADEQIDDEEDDQADPAAARLPHRQGKAAAAEAAGSPPVLDPSAAAASAPLHGGDHSPRGRVPYPSAYTSRHGAGSCTAARVRAPARAEAPAHRLRRRRRARGAGGDARQALDQEGLEAAGVRPRRADDGPDHAGGRRHAREGRRALLEGDAPGPGRPVRAARRGRVRLPEPRPDGEGAARRLQRQGGVGRDRVPVRAVAARGQARRRA